MDLVSFLTNDRDFLTRNSDNFDDHENKNLTLTSKERQLENYRNSLITLKEENEYLEEDLTEEEQKNYVEIGENLHEKLNKKIEKIHNKTKINEIYNNLEKFIDSNNGISDYYNSKHLFHRKTHKYPVNNTLDNYKKKEKLLKKNYTMKNPKADVRKSKTRNSVLEKGSNYGSSGVSSFILKSESEKDISYGSINQSIESDLLGRKLVKNNQYNSYSSCYNPGNHEKKKKRKSTVRMKMLSKGDTIVKQNSRIQSERCFKNIEPSMDIGLHGGKDDELNLMLETKKQAVNFKKRNYSGPVTLNFVLNQAAGRTEIEAPDSAKKKKRKKKKVQLGGVLKKRG